MAPLHANLRASWARLYSVKAEFIIWSWVVVAYAFNPSPRGGGRSRGSLWVQGQPALQIEFQDSQGYTEKRWLKKNQPTKQTKTTTTKTPKQNRLSQRYMIIGQLVMHSPPFYSLAKPVLKKVSSFPNRQNILCCCSDYLKLAVRLPQSLADW